MERPADRPASMARWPGWLGHRLASRPDRPTQLEFLLLSSYTLQALIDFRDSILNNKIPLSNVTSGANVAYAVEIGIQAMDTNKVIEWDSKKFII